MPDSGAARVEFGLPTWFAPEVLVEAARAAGARPEPGSDRVDATGICAGHH